MAIRGNGAISQEESLPKALQLSGVTKADGN